MISFIEIVYGLLVWIALSPIGGLILWGCARGIAKIEKATFLNSWGLFGILLSCQFVFNWLIVTVMTASQSFSVVVIALWVIWIGGSIWMALRITKGFWKCSWKQSFKTHIVPICTCFILFIIAILIILFASGSSAQCEKIVPGFCSEPHYLNEADCNRWNYNWTPGIVEPLEATDKAECQIQGGTWQDYEDSNIEIDNPYDYYPDANESDTDAW